MHCVERHFFVNVEIIMHSFYLVLHAHIVTHTHIYIYNQTHSMTGLCLGTEANMF